MVLGGPGLSAGLSPVSPRPAVEEEWQGSWSQVGLALQRGPGLVLV